jgi:GxxExxY protein
MTYTSLSDNEERIARWVVDASYTVHATLGPGLPVRVYKVCFCHELSKHGLKTREQVVIPITYDGIEIPDALRIDVYVEDLVICELKAVDDVNPVWTAQILTHLKLTGHRLGFLINFNVPLIKDGIKRITL